MSKAPFLLEIGGENIPASYIGPAFRQLAEDARKLLDEHRLVFDSVYTTGTPRRLVLIVDALEDRQSAADETITGPPMARAFDESGKPTKAAEGFARSLGTTPEKLGPIDTPKGPFLGTVRKLPRRSATSVLRETVPGLIEGLRFPRAMKWEPTGARFARPVRWIVSLYGKSPVAITFAGVKSGRKTFRRPWMKGEHAAIASASVYRAAIKRLGVIVDHDERRERIRALATKAASSRGLKLVEDDALIDELTFMTEDPQVLVGDFDKKYLELPPEVVTTAMRSHQRYLALTEGKKKLSPHFITFTDAKATGPAEVRRGNEKVLRARLEDAGFYWQEDRRKGMDGLAAELDRIVFVEGLGTLGEKAARIARVARFAGAASADTVAADATIDRAARLAKADIGSEMVKDGKEFTKLQGVIGAYYADAAGEPKEIVDAIRDHYAPRTPAESVPRSALARVIGIADRIDTIVGCFAVGLIPSGSQDPYALRRGGNGLVRLLADDPDIDLRALLDASIASYGEVAAAANVSDQVAEFLEGRVAAFLKDHRIAYDVADAVGAVSWTRPGVALRRAQAIARLRGDAAFERLITGVKRAGNIIAEENRRYGLDWSHIEAALSGGELDGGIRFSEAAFEDDTESALVKAISGALPDIRSHEASGDVDGVLVALSGLADPIDRFFDGVLVNSPDEAVRNNRHGLLSVVFAIFARYADFSQIVEKG